ncbi:MAG: transposase [Kordiimonadaceae bacterium]|nr:transposase [Kordiimonadaceae bacterium]
MIDILKEADLQVGFTDQFHTASSRQNLSSETLQQRLLLGLYAIGTNAGLKRISSANDDVTYEDLRYIKRAFIDVPGVRAAIVKVVNKVLAVRDPRCWGEATTTVACDSKKISVWDQNLMVEWHSRYKGRGVMVYWHVDQNSLCIYSQLKTCSSSEVGAVIKGLLHHGTRMEMKNATMDTHGQSLIGFGTSEFLGFDLLPRLKNIDIQKLYYPFAKDKKRYGNLEKILKGTIDWKLMAENYDETIKHMVALKLGLIEPEMFVKRFSHDNYQHPVYQTLLEFGKVAKTIFLCRYLSDEGLRIEIHASQNIVERLNSIMSFIFYGKVGEISSNDKEDQELSIVCLHLLQACMGYVNTLLIQEILAQPSWRDVLTPEDKRALNVLFHSHINPYGLFPLDLRKRLGIGAETTTA